MRYALFFALAIVGLTAVVVLTFDRISANTLAPRPVATAPADTLPTPVVSTPVTPTARDYERYAAADKAWREKHARFYGIEELRARGDGKRSAREAMQDQVYTYMKRGDRTRAIAELERWVRAHRRDRESLLSLARLLNESGRTNEAIVRYRQVLALQGRSE